MTLYEIHFAPTKRRVRGVHQPDISYRLPAESVESAKTIARRLIAAEHPTPPYRLTLARERTEA